MTKLAAALPDGHGLDAVRRHLLETPRRRHIAIGLVSTKSVTDDYDKGEKEPTAAFRQLEVITYQADTTLAEQLLSRAYDRRQGATLLPIDVEDIAGAAFPGRSEDVSTDLAGQTKNLDDHQARELGHSLDRPLRHELRDAIDVLRSNKEWVKLGRARRVLQLAIATYEENDKRLLRDEDGYLVDPETGAIVDEEKLTSEDLDRMLAALDEAEKEEGGPGDGEEPPAA